MAEARPVLLSDVRFTRAPMRLFREGLLGWVSCVLGETLRIDGLTIRRTGCGRLAFGFPERVDSRGRRHAIVRPVSQGAREAIERAVLDALAHQLATNTGGTLPPAVSPDEPSGITPNPGGRS